MSEDPREDVRNKTATGHQDDIKVRVIGMLRKDLL